MNCKIICVKKTLSLIMALILLLSVAPAFAETAGTASDDIKTGLTNLLAGLESELTGGENGKLSEELSSLKDLLKNKLSEANADAKLSEILHSAADRIAAALTSGAGENSGILKLLKEGLSKEGGPELESLMGALFAGGSEDLSDEEWDKMLEEYYNSPEYQDVLAREAAIREYIVNEYGDTLEAGDVQFICIGSGLDDVKEDGTYQYLRNLSLTNYTVDGANLRMKNYAGNVEMLYLAKQDDGTYQVTEAVQAEDGENYAASIAAMSEKYGASLETVNINLGEKEWAEAFDLACFLREKPEYEKVEYQGELRTAEELDVIADAALDAALADVDFSF